MRVVGFIIFNCATSAHFTVVVLMRDESGYMMLLMLLPFHQQNSKHFFIFKTWSENKHHNIMIIAIVDSPRV